MRGTNNKDVTKENRENRILEIIKNEPNISMKEMSNILNVNLRTINRDIEKLKQKKLIERSGGRKKGFWEKK